MTARPDTMIRALSDKDNAPIVQNTPVAPLFTGYNAQNIRFGLEIECYLPERYKSAFPVGHYHNGLPLPFLPDGWTGQKDATLTDAPKGYFPIEIVSPILSGEDGIGQIWLTMELLGKLKAVVSPKCGIHVHVESVHMTLDQLESLAIAYKHYEGFFFALNGREGSNRLNSGYCLPSYMWSKPVDFSNRYRALNFATAKMNGNSTRGNTVEFRLFAGILKPEFLVTIIYASLGLVSHVINDSVDYPVNLPMGTTININKLAKQFYKKVWGKSENKVFGDEDMMDVKGYISNLLPRFSPTPTQKDRLMLAD